MYFFYCFFFSFPGNEGATFHCSQSILFGHVCPAFFSDKSDQLTYRAQRKIEGKKCDERIKPGAMVNIVETEKFYDLVCIFCVHSKVFLFGIALFNEGPKD